MSGEPLPAEHNGHSWSRKATKSGKRFVKDEFIFGICRRGGNLPPEKMTHQKRAADSCPYGVNFHLSENKPRAHLHRRMVVSKCALSIF